jgi:hypothetical protein
VIRVLRSDAFVLALAGLPALVFLGHLFAPAAPLYAAWLGARGLLALGSITKLSLLLGAGLRALAASRHLGEENPMRPAWRMLGAGMLAMFAGQVCLAPYQLVWQVASPFPSLADAFFVAAYPLMIAALSRFVRAFEESGFAASPEPKRGCRTLVLAIGLGLLAVPATWPVIAAGRPPLETALNLIYPGLDLLLLAPAALLLRVSLALRGGAIWPVWGGLLAGFGCLAGGDLLFGYFSSLEQAHLESLVDLLFVAAYGSFLFGCTRQHRLVAPDADPGLAPDPVPARS